MSLEEMIQTEKASSEYIVTTIRAHYFLTFFLYPLSLDTRIAAYEEFVPELSIDEFMESGATLTSLLRCEKIKNIFDSDEMAALHNFNFLRNSLAHSSDATVFFSLSPDYFDIIIDLIDQVDSIFKWLASKSSFEIAYPQ
jgi:hypothetical protein